MKVFIEIDLASMSEDVRAIEAQRIASIIGGSNVSVESAPVKTTTSKNAVKEETGEDEPDFNMADVRKALATASKVGTNKVKIKKYMSDKLGADTLAGVSKADIPKLLKYVSSLNAEVDAESETLDW